MSGLPSTSRDGSAGPLLDLLLGEIVPRIARTSPSPTAFTGESRFARVDQDHPIHARPVAGASCGDLPARTGHLDLNPRAADDPASRLLRAAVRGDAAAGAAVLERLLATGETVETVLLEVIQPAARSLGRCWDEDELSFAEVTLAAGLLQRLMTLMLEGHPRRSRPDSDPASDPAHRPTALFCALPGCQHRLGLRMVGAIFARAGWHARVADDQPEAGLLEQLLEMQPALLGLSIGSEMELQRAAGFILRAREVSVHFNPVVMVGGAATARFPSRAAALGADFVSGDGDDALGRASLCLRERRVAPS